MNIAIWHNLPSGGGKRALSDHVKGLVERGHHVESWCPPTADQTYLPLSEIIQEHIVPLKDAPRTWWQEMQRKLTAGLDIMDRVSAMQEHSQECARQMKHGGFDLLFANSCHFFAAPFIGRYADMPKVLYLQEPYRAFYEARPELPWIAPVAARQKKSVRTARIFYKELRELQGVRIQAREELTNAQAFDTILVNSYFSRESVLRAYNISAHVCYLGVDTSLFQGDEPHAREDFVVGIGAFDPRKNIEAVIEAVAATALPHPRLVWIGNSKTPEYLEALKRQAQTAGVEFEPKLRLSDQEMTDLLRRATVMAYAPFLEPFGFAPLEANACGLPVVAVAEGGMRETVQDGVNGLLTAHDPRAMAAAMDRLRGDAGYARALGDNGRRLVREQWSIGVAVDRLEQRFREAVERKSDCLPV